MQQNHLPTPCAVWPMGDIRWESVWTPGAPRCSGELRTMPRLVLLPSTLGQVTGDESDSQLALFPHSLKGARDE